MATHVIAPKKTGGGIPPHLEELIFWTRRMVKKSQGSKKSHICKIRPRVRISWKKKLLSRGKNKNQQIYKIPFFIKYRAIG